MAAGHLGGRVRAEAREDADVGGGGVEGDEGRGVGGGLVGQPGAEGEEGAFDVDFCLFRKDVSCQLASEPLLDGDDE